MNPRQTARIGIDVRMWGHPGIGRYIRELSRELLRQSGKHELHFLGNSSCEEEFRKEGAPFRKLQSPIYSLEEQFEIPWKSKDLDLLHAPHFNIPAFFNKKLVVTIHDLIYLHEPGAAKSKWGRPYASWLFRMIEKKAAAILTVSEYTKKDLLESFPKLDPQRVFVTHEAVSSDFKKTEDPNFLEEVKRKRALRKPFILFVGSLKLHKNIPALIHALIDLRKKKGVEHELVLVGRHDPRNVELVELLAKNPFVRYLGELEDREVLALYNLAEVFVLPSFWEGFGLPVLEAMACGTPVIASNLSSLPEVVGEAGLLFNPHEVDALGEVLYNVLTDKELRKNMSEKGLERVKQFSWAKTAEQTLRVYEQVLS